MKMLIAFALVAVAAAVSVNKPMRIMEAPEPEVFEEPADEIADAFQEDLETNPEAVFAADAPFDTVIVEQVKFVENAESYGFDDAAEPSNINDNVFVHPLAYGGFEELGIEPSNFDDDVYVHPFAYGAFDELPQNVEAAADEETADQAAPSPLNIVAIQDMPSETDDDARSTGNFVEIVEDSEGEIVPSAINFVEMPSPLSLGEIPAPDNFEERESA